MITRKTSLSFFVLAASVLCGTISSAYAISFGKPGGEWPKTWPEQLEPFRAQAWTWEHGFGGMSYDISFKTREEFEAVWPDILKLQSQGATLTLQKGNHVRVWSTKDKKPKGKTAGVRIYMPRSGSTTGPLSQTRIWLVVDGNIVDLNRILLPADTPVDDRRFPKK